MKEIANSNAQGKMNLEILESYLQNENVHLRAIFDPISIGILFVNIKKKAIIFSNAFFQSMLKNQEFRIMESIYEHIEKKIHARSHFSISQEIHIQLKGKNLHYGFTTYKIHDEIVAILLSEIASKSIYFQSKQENEFYTKLSELVAEIAHEIGNPLSGISMSLQVILQNLSVWPKEKITDYIERTINEINRLTVFLKRIRDISDEYKLEMKTINLRSTIDDVFHQNQEILKQKNIIFKNLVDKNLSIWIDEVAFFQIILNLLKNSLQILESGEEIRIYVESIDDFYIKLIYRNNGRPIPSELLEKIFFPFYTTKRNGGGIGLSISLKLMSRMGGTMIAVQPEDGIGAKFIIYIPNEIKR